MTNPLATATSTTRATTATAPHTISMSDAPRILAAVRTASALALLLSDDPAQPSLFDLAAPAVPCPSTVTVHTPTSPDAARRIGSLIATVAARPAVATTAPAPAA